jgi:hypothetical protein
MRLAHNFIHRKCSQVQTKPAKPVPMPRTEKEIFLQCCIIAQWKNTVKNQRSLIWNMPLHTILSTELVQNCTCCIASNLLHCRIRFSSASCLLFIFRSSLVRYSSSRRLAHLAIADCLDHRPCLDHRTPDLPAPRKNLAQAIAR